MTVSILANVFVLVVEHEKDNDNNYGDRLQESTGHSVVRIQLPESKYVPFSIGIE